MSNPGILLDKYDPLNARWGAKGDGVTHDDGAINAAAAQASIDAGSSGKIRVPLRNGYGFRCGAPLKMYSGVEYYCDGATVIPDWASIGGVAGDSLFLVPSNTQVIRAGITGGTFQGTGAEAQYNTLLYMNPGSSAIDLMLRRLYVENFQSCVLYFRNVQRTWLHDSKLINVNTNNPGNLNTVGFVNDNGGLPLFDFGALRNEIVGNTSGAALSVNCNQQASQKLKGEFGHNTCVGTGTPTNGIAGAINCETTAPSQYLFSGMRIHHNDVDVVVPVAAGSAAMNVSESNYVDMEIDHNVFNSTYSVFRFFNSPMVTDNVANGAHADALSGTSHPYFRGNRRNGGQINGTATLVAGTVTINTAEIQAGDSVILTVINPGGTRGILQRGAIVAGTSFVVNSIQPGTASTLQNADTSTFYWEIVH